MYRKREIYCGKILEVEKYCNFNYKGKRTVRGPRTEKTSEAVAKVNERNAQKKLSRLINTNFTKNDYHLVLTYKFNQRAGNPEEAKKDLAAFCLSMRKKYKKVGLEFKYIAVTEYGKKSMHHHLVINSGLDLAAVAASWTHGRIHTNNLDGSGDYARLAAYLIKQTRKTFNDPERCVHRKRWCASRNLKRPIEKNTSVKADSWREYPVAPKGYMVITDSIESGVSEFTGWPYQYYRCIKIDDRRNDNARAKNKRTRSKAPTPKARHSTLR